MLESLVDLYRRLGGFGAGICLFILILFIGALYANILLRRKYTALSEELAGFCAGAYESFSSDILQWISGEYREAIQSGALSINTPSIIETGFQAYLKFHMIAERFLKKANSLMITAGLFGTFVGLTYAVGNISIIMANTTAEALIQDTGANSLSLLATAFQGMAVAFVTSLFGTGFSVIHILVMSLSGSSGAKSLLVSQLEEFLDIKVASELTGARTKKEKSDEENGKKAPDAISESAHAFEAAVGRFTDSVQILKDINEALSANAGGISESALLLGTAMGKASETIYDSGVRIYDCTEAVKAMTDEISSGNRRIEDMIPVLSELKNVSEDSRKDREIFLKSVYEIPDKLLNYHEAAVAGTDIRRVKE